MRRIQAAIPEGAEITAERIHGRILRGVMGGPDRYVAPRFYISIGHLSFCADPATVDLLVATIESEEPSDLTLSLEASLEKVLERANSGPPFANELDVIGSAPERR